MSFLQNNMKWVVVAASAPFGLVVACTPQKNPICIEIWDPYCHIATQETHSNSCFVGATCKPNSEFVQGECGKVGGPTKPATNSLSDEECVEFDKELAARDATEVNPSVCHIPSGKTFNNMCWLKLAAAKRDIRIEAERPENVIEDIDYDESDPKEHRVSEPMWQAEILEGAKCEDLTAEQMKKKRKHLEKMVKNIAGKRQELKKSPFACQKMKRVFPHPIDKKQGTGSKGRRLQQWWDKIYGNKKSDKGSTDEKSRESKNKSGWGTKDEASWMSTKDESKEKPKNSSSTRSSAANERKDDMPGNRGGQQKTRDSAREDSKATKTNSGDRQKQDSQSSREQWSRDKPSDTKEEESKSSADTDQTMFCTREYRPVCHTATRKTYSNLCVGRNETGDRAKESFTDGECGSDEETKKPEKEEFCTKDYRPVCHTATKNTYSNLCVGRNETGDRNKRSFTGGECGSEEEDRKKRKRGY
jgi:hypothetical protein